MLVWWIVVVVIGIGYVYMFVGGTTPEAVLPRSREFDPTILCHDKLVVVTGANKGIGYGTALAFARRGARVILACRNDERARAAVDSIIEETGNDRVSSSRLDLSSFESVRSFVDGLQTLDQPVDILVNNAGAIFDNYTTIDGHNMTVQSNFLSHALLTLEVLLRGLVSRDACLLQISSVQHKKGVLEIDNLDAHKSFGKLQFYNNTKLMQVLFAKKLADCLPASSLRRTYAVHPGIVKTDFIRSFIPKGMSSVCGWILDKVLVGPEGGAQSILYASLSPKLAGSITNGAYIDNCKVTQSSAMARSPELQDELWKYVLELFSVDENDIKNLKDDQSCCRR